jgi:hypothetical protein
MLENLALRYQALHHARGAGFWRLIKYNMQPREHKKMKYMGDMVQEQDIIQDHQLKET